MITPIGGRVAVREFNTGERVHSSGLVIPDSASTGDAVVEVEVVAVGAGSRVNGELIPVAVKSGDKVLISRYAGVECEVADEKWKIVNESDILAVVG